MCPPHCVEPLPENLASTHWPALHISCHPPLLRSRIAQITTQLSCLSALAHARASDHSTHHQKAAAASKHFKHRDLVRSQARRAARDQGRFIITATARYSKIGDVPPRVANTAHTTTRLIIRVQLQLTILISSLSRSAASETCAAAAAANSRTHAKRKKKLQNTIAVIYAIVKSATQLVLKDNCLFNL